MMRYSYYFLILGLVSSFQISFLDTLLAQDTDTENFQNQETYSDQDQDQDQGAAQSGDQDQETPVVLSPKGVPAPQEPLAPQVEEAPQVIQTPKGTPAPQVAEKPQVTESIPAPKEPNATGSGKLTDEEKVAKVLEAIQTSKSWGELGSKFGALTENAEKSNAWKQGGQDLDQYLKQQSNNPPAPKK